jgi:CRISPR-associated endonuclease/helicase Cas3
VETPDIITQFWAKTTPDGQPGITVRDHCLNVGCVAQALIDALPIALADKNLAVWLAACHDIGKISPGFQSKCDAWLLQNGFTNLARTRAWMSAEKDHSKVSQFTLQHLFRERSSASAANAAFWAAVAGMHHGTPHWRGEWNLTARSGIPLKDEWEQHRRALAKELQALAPAPERLPTVDLSDYSSLWWTAGLITIADWIGSDENYFSATRNSAPVSLDATRIKARAALQQINLECPQLAPGRSFHDLFGSPPYSLQESTLAMIQSPGVYVIEAPMGAGKTEAALAAAYQLISTGQANGLYFALPTQATSNRIHERVTTFLERIQSAAPRLIHGSSWLAEKETRLPTFDDRQPDAQQPAARDWFASSKRALIAPFGVGTVDQALLGVVAVKHFFVRHFALAGKVVVLDEVHSYDVFTGTLIEALISALVKLRCTVIILSATLTHERRQQILKMASGDPAVMPERKDDFPLITGVTDGKFVSSRNIDQPASNPAVAVHFLAGPKILECAVQAARGGARVLWICNTVDRAQASYRAICGERCEGDPPVGLLHARFPFFRREVLENDWMQKLGKDRGSDKQPLGCLLVSTQIVEQSVDLDADLLITELAPTDMLFQRLGRLWRHRREARPFAQPEVWILEEEAPFDTLRGEQDVRALRKALGKKASIYAPYVLLRTLEQWQDKTRVCLPGDIRLWLEATYQRRTEEDRPGWKALLAELEAKRRSHMGQAEMAQNVWNLPALKDEEGVGTRLNECPTLPLILVKAADSKSITFLEGHTIEVQSRRFDYAAAKAMHRNMVKAPAWWFADKSRCLKSMPASVAAMVSLHMRGRVEMGMLNGNALVLDSLKKGDVLSYDDAMGLLRESLGASAVPTASNWSEDDDEHCD